MRCLRHRAAATHGSHCAACLLERALLPDEDLVSPATAQFAIQIPLSETASASVYLVRSDQQARLLRLKRWHGQAPVEFLERFEQLQTNLERWSQPLIPIPLRAWVDQAGRPSTLSEFRQGMPILNCLRSGRLAAAAALKLLTQLEDAAAAGHQRGLVHGSIVPGNLLVDTSGTSAHLLDFGLAALLLSATAEAPSVATDEAGFASLERTIRESAAGRSGFSL